MKRLIIAACVTITLALAGQVKAETKPEAKSHHEMTADQKAVWKEIVTKYDTNKDGKLSKEERAKISADDKAKLEKAGLLHQHHKEEKKDKDSK